MDLGTLQPHPHEGPVGRARGVDSTSPEADADHVDASVSPDVVRNRLSLGGNGLVVGAIVSLPRSRALTEQFTSMYVYNRAGSRVLRSMGRDIAIRTAMRFLDKGDFIIPGIDQLQSG